MRPKNSGDKARAVEEYRNGLLDKRNKFKERFENECFLMQFGIARSHIICILGSGGFGVVYKGTIDGSVMAIKVLSKAKLYENHSVETAIREKDILSCIKDMNNPFVCNIIGHDKDGVNVYMMLEFAKFGTLDDYYNVKNVGEAHARQIVSQVVCGIEFIHALNIIFRDLKLKNCLLYEKGRVKISDFGLATVAPTEETDRAGTTDYAAPEVLNGLNIMDAVDWWSLGVLTYALLLRCMPFRAHDSQSDEEVAMNIANQPPRGLRGANISEEAKSFIEALLQKHPGMRLGSGAGGATAVKQHEWFASVDWHDVIFEDFQFEVEMPEVSGKSVGNPSMFQGLPKVGDPGVDQLFERF